MADASGSTHPLPARNPSSGRRGPPRWSRRGVLAAAPALALTGTGAGGGDGGAGAAGPTPAWGLLDTLYRPMLVGDGAPVAAPPLAPPLDEDALDALGWEADAARTALYAHRPRALADAVALLLGLAIAADDPLSAEDVGLVLAVVDWLTRDAPHLARPDLAACARRQARRGVTGRV